MKKTLLIFLVFLAGCEYYLEDREGACAEYKLTGAKKTTCSGGAAGWAVGGGVVGFLVGGPIGAIVGASVGGATTSGKKCITEDEKKCIKHEFTTVCIRGFDRSVVNIKNCRP